MPHSRVGCPSLDRAGRARRKGHLSALGVRSVVGQMLVFQLVVVLLLAVGASALLLLEAQHDSRREAVRRSVAVAESLAHAPGIEQALSSPDPTAVLQPRAEAIRKASGVDFVVITDRRGIRYTHPNPHEIGQPSTGDIAAVVASGRTFIDEGSGTLGPQIRANTPVKDARGTVIGVVIAGVTFQTVNGTAARRIPEVLGIAAAAVVVTAGGAALLSRRLWRQTHGLGPAEITRMYEHHDAVLHSVREGVLILDENRCLMLANDEAERLLALPPDAEGRRVEELGLDPETARLLTSGCEVTDAVHLTGDRLLAINQRPIERYGEPAGSVTTLRDSTELQALSGRAEAARARLKLLYDAGVRIGTTLEVTRTAEELAEAVVARFADFVTVDLAEPVLRGEEPTGTEELRRTAVAGIRDDHPLYPVGRLGPFDSVMPRTAGQDAVRAFIEPDLRNAPGFLARDAERAARITAFGIHSFIAAPLCARDTVIGVAGFWRSEKPEPFEDEDLAIAEELAARAAVSIDNARRYTREHRMAVTLQRSLLPRELPEQDAVEAVYRYLPAQADVGGDWFDVIPLSGARVALVVGDVVGHGMQASARMGRMRAAMRTLADMDLPPDELLTHLDDVVLRAPMDGAADPDGSESTAATCLYAVYDPVSRRCTLARAGHPLPVVVTPDGRADMLELPAGPPLGVGGLPFEVAEVELPEGSLLALYTDGLLQRRGHDTDEGTASLRRALARPAESLDGVCGNVLEALLPAARTDDDVALLIARTRALGADQVASWDVPSDPAMVAQARQKAAAQLTAWGLDEAVFTTELVVSELVTNAIRYGRPPVKLRLIHGRSLSCEVSDGSDTTPHLRRARVFDEGGRGLLLVAQLTQRWGTRHIRSGKIIWAEQDLPVS
ncbi:SpoIIE family protein phosphatase [Streptomyces sp. NPDC002577]